MKIYLDIILFENLCMNYIILFATSVVLKREIKQYRLILASFIGGLYAIIIYLNIIGFASNIIMKILLSIGMVWLAFNSDNYKKFLKDLLIFYLVSFVFGGCAIALIYFVNPTKVQMNNGVLVGMYPIKVTLIAGVVAFIIIQIGFKITKNKLSPDDMICNIEIYFLDKRKKVKALVDSGNMLKDPISKYPVIVVERKMIGEILPEELLNNVDFIERGNVLGSVASEYETKIRIIPFSSLGKQNGMLVGIKVDKIKVEFNEKEIYIDNVIMGIYDKKLTKYDKYNALIGLEIIDER